MLVCSECGYAYYRTSTRTSKRKLYYYRCLGSDNYRHANGRVCDNRPIRQDYLDGVVWEQVIQLLENPELVRVEMQRRIKQIQDSSPTKRRKEVISKEIIRISKGIEKLLDAYQEGLVKLEELRKRLPELRKREEALKSELNSIEAATVNQNSFIRLASNIEEFLERLRNTANTLSVIERQKILRLVVKEIFVEQEKIRIKHSIPVTESITPAAPLKCSKTPGYLLRSGSDHSPLRGPLLGIVDRPVLHHTCLKPFAQRAQYYTVSHPLAVKLPQIPVLYRVEVASNIDLQHPTAATHRHDPTPQRLQCLVRAAPPPKSI
jgi:site-specific DNA recombinase